MKSPEDIRLIDPCMGSGHILVYAFDVLMQIYESEGYNPRDAAKLILEKNIYGLDIDRRAYQLAYFSLMMKARQYNRRIFTDGVKPQVYHPAGFPDGEEYGSLVKVHKLEPMPELPKEQQMTLFDGSYEAKLNAWNFKRLLAQKYDVVVTNPPYMGSKGMSAKMSELVKNNYPDSKSDLFAVFIEKCGELLKPTGYQAMITQHAWMFLSSYEKLRSKLMLRDTVNMAHLGARAFAEIGGEVVQSTAFVLRGRHISDYKGTYVRLVDIGDADGKEQAFLSGNHRYTASSDNFAKIPGSPVAYWVSDNFIQIFEKGKPLSSFANVPKGLSTGSVDRFMRFWYEVNDKNINYGCSDCKDTEKAKEKWYPYAKGGIFRRWNGNLEYVVNWKNNGFEVKNFVDDKGKQRSRPQNTAYYFKKCMTYSAITSYKLSLRYLNHCIFGGGGDSIHSVDDKYFNYLLAFVNTELQTRILKLISPTMNFEVDHLKKLPIIVDEAEIDNVNRLVQENVDISGDDWNAFETSWGFRKHPLLNNVFINKVKHREQKWEFENGKNDPNSAIKLVSSRKLVNTNTYNTSIITGDESISVAFKAWKRECKDRFNQLKANEEELNRIFIDIYGLQDELTPEVEDKDVTVHRIFELKEDIPELMKGSRYALTKEDVIKSLISYAVGCMFGRYSLDVEGLAYAGGDWDNGKYSTFIPDADNCIPITDEEYFEDDIVGLFCAWLKKVYGEDTLEENLDFIAKALGNKGNTSREVIRNYFLNDFMKDHIKIYRKRPIYWMFDSGKQNGFKALCYMHRWNADTTGNMRVEYLHRMQRVYDKEIERMQQTIDNSTNSREVSAAEKRKDKLTKQLKETKDYDTKIAHLALSRIDIDLDDGVKVNYEKVQTAPDGKKMQILAKI